MAVRPVQSVDPAAELVVHNAHPFAMGGVVLAVGEEGSAFADHGLSFDNSGRNGHYARIAWSNDCAAAGMLPGRRTGLAVPRVGPTALATTVVAGALAAWILTARELRGMDAGHATDLGELGWYVCAWVTMMAAMMLPSVAPMALVVARVSGQRRGGDGFLPTCVFLCGYPSSHGRPTASPPTASTAASAPPTGASSPGSARGRWPRARRSASRVSTS